MKLTASRKKQAGSVAIFALLSGQSLMGMRASLGQLTPLPAGSPTHHARVHVALPPAYWRDTV